MKIKSNALGILIITILFGGIFVSTAMNIWKTESSKVPQLIQEGEFKGEYNPEDIRGSYSFGEISELFSIPLEDLSHGFNLPKEVEASAFKNKDLEPLYENLEFEIGNGSVKLFVALYKGLPYELEDDTYLLKNAVRILKNKANLTQGQVEFLDSHTIALEDIDINNIPENGEDQEETEEIIIKGNTTFKDIMDWGVSKEKIEKILGLALPNPVMSIKDYCMEKELSFSTVKSDLEKEIDKIER